ncbi:hypothetical protein MAP00_006114 [Monascus purpureus]|nr:hypothetical protein MAP00_006114 [Monascus purpureus]
MPLIFALNGAHTAARFPSSYTFTSGSQNLSLISSCMEDIRSTNEPMVQKRRGLDDEEGGESDIPPARTQSFSNPARDFALNAVRNPFATAMILSTSSEGSGGMGVRTRHLKHIVVKADVSRLHTDSEK